MLTPRVARGSSWAILLAASLTAANVCRAEGEGESPAEHAVPGAAAEEIAVAQKQFDDGMRLFDAEKYEEALVAFRASFAVVRSPNSRLMIADALARLGRKVEAYAEYQETAADAKASPSPQKYAPAAEAAAAEMEKLAGDVALVVLEVRAPEGSKLSVDGTDLPSNRWSRPVPVAPDVEVRFEVISPDGAKDSEATRAAAGAKTRVSLRVEGPTPKDEPATVETPSTPADEGKPGLRIAAYVAGGVGAVGLVGAGVGLIAGADNDLVAGGLIVGLVGLGAGTGLYLVSLPSSSGSSRTGPTVAVSVGAGSASVSGAF